MIVSREEFHQRMSFIFDKIEVKDELMSVERLYKEIVADAPFRSHNFMFDKGMDWRELLLQESDGIVKKFPEIKTEGERYEKIKEEILNDTYEAVPVSKDADYNDVIYVENGFHRIWIANELGMKVMRVKAAYGKFNLTKNINFGDLVNLLGMIDKLFGKDKKVAEIKKMLEDAIKKKPDMAKHHSLSYGGKVL